MIFLEELTAPRELTNEPMVTTPSPVLVSFAMFAVCVHVCERERNICLKSK